MSQKRKRTTMSAAQRRVAITWLAYYAKFDKLPQMGAIVFGGGLNSMQAVSDARDQGYYVKTQTDQFAALHR